MTDCRLRRSYSQVELAALIGVSRRTVEEWETNGRVPTPPFLRRWAEALGLDEAEAGELALRAGRLRERQRRRRRAAAA